MAGEPWDCEDEIALVNGGERRESNLRPFLRAHHKAKTARDVAEKSRVYRRKRSHLGIRKSAQPMPGSRASAWKRKMSGEVVRRG